jgi:hypothetical protein
VCLDVFTLQDTLAAGQIDIPFVADFRKTKLQRKKFTKSLQRYKFLCEMNAAWRRGLQLLQLTSRNKVVIADILRLLLGY